MAPPLALLTLALILSFGTVAGDLLSLSLERVLIVQVDSRAIDAPSSKSPQKQGNAPVSPVDEIQISTAPYSSLTPVLNHHYCKQHGYDYLLVQPFIDVPKTLASLLPNELTYALPGFDNTSSDARQEIGAYHHNLRQLRSVSWAKLPTLLYLSLQIGRHYDLIWYVDSDMGISNKPTGRSIKEKLDVIKDASACLGPKRETPCINWGRPDVHSSPMLLFPNSPFGDTEPCAGTFMFRPALASSMLLEWWDVDMPEKAFGLMHEQDALWNLTSVERTTHLRVHSPNGTINPSTLSRRTVTLLQEFQFPPKNDKKEMCTDGRQWLCHLITTDHEYRAPWFREMLIKAGFTQQHFKAAIRHIKHSLSMRLDMFDVALLVDKHASLLRANRLNAVNGSDGSVKLDSFPRGLKFVPEDRKRQTST